MGGNNRPLEPTVFTARSPHNWLSSFSCIACSLIDCNGQARRGRTGKASLLCICAFPGVIHGFVGCKAAQTLRIC